MSRTKPASTGGTAQAGQRLQQELMQLMMDPIENVTAFPEEDNLFYWVGAIQGAPNTAYEGLEYRLSLRFPGSYPIEPPVVVFLTSCFHPNVDPSGVICLDILKENWSAAISIRELLLSILSLLDNANVDSPLNQEAARLWGTPGEYQRRVRQCYDEAVMKAQASAPNSRS